MRWDLFDEFNRFQREFEKYMSNLFGQDDFDREYLPRRNNAVEPYRNYRKALADVWEDDNKIVATVELPGVEKKDIDIKAKDGGLEIKVEKNNEDRKENKNGYSYRRSYTGFYRYISLPDYADMENIKASYKNGVLEVTIPKKNSGKSKKINIE